MVTIDEVIALTRAEIERLDRSLNRWLDPSMPAYRRTIQQKQQKQAYLDSLLRQQHAPTSTAHVAQKSDSQPGGGLSVQKHGRADQWQDFHSRFMQIASEEQQLVLQIVEATGRKDELYLYAYRTPENGPWRVGGGVSEDLRERAGTLAASAGNALRCVKGTDREDFWLHRLYHYLRQNRSKHLFEQHVLEPSQEGGAILRVCKASATFCSWLVRQSPRQAPATTIGRNIYRLRMECGWSLDRLAEQTGMDKKLILSHVNKGARPTPRILKEYAQAFSKGLRRTITAPDLEE